MVMKPRGVASRASRSPAMFTIRWVTPGKTGTTWYQVRGIQIEIPPLVLRSQTCLHWHPLSSPTGRQVEIGLRLSSGGRRPARCIGGTLRALER